MPILHAAAVATTDTCASPVQVLLLERATAIVAYVADAEPITHVSVAASSWATNAAMLSL